MSKHVLHHSSQSTPDDESLIQNKADSPSAFYNPADRLTPNKMLWLQRNVGNRTARKMVTAHRTKQASVQRQADEEGLEGIAFMAYPETATEAAQEMGNRRESSGQTKSGQTSQAAPIQRDLDLSSVRFAPLPDINLSVVPLAPLNVHATTLMESIREAGALSSSVQGSVSYLNYGAETGERDLGAIREVRDTLGRRARSDGDLREAMESFVSANQDMSGRVHDLRSTMSGVAEAAHDMHRVVVQGQALTAGREVTAAQGAVTAVETRIETAKSRAETVVDTAAELLQGNWTDAIVEVGKFLGNELLGAGIDAAYSEELQAAQAQLTEAQSRLQSLEDEAQAANLSRATAGLERANAQAERAKSDLIALARRADRAQTNLSNILDRMGMTEAVDALNARSSMMGTTSSAISEMQQYQDKVETVKEQSTQVKEDNQMVIDFILSPGGESSFPDSEFRLALFSRADMNKSSARRVEEWADAEPDNIAALRQQLQEGAFLTDFNQMVTEIDQSLST